MKAKLLVTAVDPPEYLIEILELQNKFIAANGLIGNILATIKLNYDKGNLSVKSGTENDWEMLIESWYEKYLKLKTKREIDGILEKYDFSSYSHL